MAQRSLSPFELRIVNLVAEEVSANESREVRVALPWLTDFLQSRNSTVLTASSGDLETFCETRAKTRNQNSMTRLISVLRVIFSLLFAFKERSDDPSVHLKRPKINPSVADFRVDASSIDHVLAAQRKATENATGTLEFTRKRRLAILYLAAEAGALCPEIPRLDLDDLDRPLVLARGTPRERPAQLSSEGQNALTSYGVLRRSRQAVDSAALFVSRSPPRKRLDGKQIAKEIADSIALAGPLATGLTVAKFHRFLPATVMSAGLGWNIAAASVGYQMIPNLPVPAVDTCELANLVEKHHPMGAMYRSNRSI